MTGVAVLESRDVSTTSESPWPHENTLIHVFGRSMPTSRASSRCSLSKATESAADNNSMPGQNS